MEIGNGFEPMLKVDPHRYGFLELIKDHFGERVLDVRNRKVHFLQVVDTFTKIGMTLAKAYTLDKIVVG